MIKIIDVEYKNRYELELMFNNGESGLVDLEKYLTGENYEPLKDLTKFIQFGLTKGTLEWFNGADFAPEFLYDIMINYSKNKTRLENKKHAN
jgi:hypothetical protein